MSLISPLVSFSSCSVILESDPQQVIQKVNFRVRVPCMPSSPLGCPSHPARLLSSLCWGCQGLGRGRGRGRVGWGSSSSSRSDYWDDALGGAAVWGCQSVKEICCPLPCRITKYLPLLPGGKYRLGKQTLKETPVAALALKLGSGSLDRMALPSVAFLSELNLFSHLYSLHSLTLHAPKAGPRGSWLPSDKVQGFYSRVIPGQCWIP